MNLPGWVRRRNGVVVILAATALVAYGGVALARDGSPGHLAKAGSRQQLTASSTGGACKVAFDTETATIYPDNTFSNDPAGRVVMTKPCAGAAAVTFSSETWTPNTGDFIDLQFRATCTGTGGYSTHCTVGNTRDASPGVINFATYAHHDPESHAYTQVFTGLNRGKWRFDVVPRGTGNLTASVRWRTTMVQALNGG